MATKQSYDMALSRLIIIIQKLYEGESVSVSGLAEEFGKRTVFLSQIASFLRLGCSCVPLSQSTLSVDRCLRHKK